MLLMPHGLAVAALNEDRLGQVSAELTDGTEVQFGDKDFAQRVRRFVALLESEVPRIRLHGLIFVMSAAQQFCVGNRVLQ